MVPDDQFDFWQWVHDTIGSMSEWERGWYKAVIESALFNCFPLPEATEPPWPVGELYDGGEIYRFSIPVDNEDGKWIIARYSPSGNQRHAETFYAPTPPLADDTIEILFDEDKFRATWAEVDSEACLCYYHLEYHIGKYVSRIHVVHAITESEYGLPESWQIWPQVQEAVVITDKEDA